MMRAPRSQVRGFTLIEMAVVVAIVVLLLGSILVPLATQIEERRISDTQRLLDDAREALLGFLVANGRLPCPASAVSNGAESPPGGGNCSNPYNGFLPAATLGLTPTDAQGYLLDPWGNRVRYAVTAWGSGSPAFTTPNGLSGHFMAGPLAPDLQVCSTAAGVSGSPPSCAAGTRLSDSAPAVIYSTGPNGLTGGTSADEAQNPNINSANNDRLFVSRPPGSQEASGGAFDDILTWLSPYVVYSRLVGAGRLP
jgi:prepilin-type N-terminal cleavage/methylation domain-containing protein